MTRAIPSILLLTLTLALPAGATIPEAESGSRLEQLTRRLADPETSARALEDALAGPDAAATLGAIAASDADIAARGWAISGLAQLRGDTIDTQLAALDVGGQPSLVRSWSAAARIQRAQSLEALVGLAPAARRRPELSRPLALRVAALSGGAELAQLIALAAANPDLQAPLGPTIASAPVADLVSLVYGAEEDGVRRLAAGYAATRGQQDPEVGAAVIEALAFRRRAARVPWQGGALYIPSLGWDPVRAKPLVGHLIAWRVWCDQRGQQQQINQIWNNLRSVGLLSAAGLGRSVPNDSVQLVRAYGEIMGGGALRELIGSLGLLEDPRYRKLLEAR